MKAGDQIITCQDDIARRADSLVYVAIRAGLRGVVVDMAPPLYQGSAQVKFHDDQGEYFVQYEAICLAPGYASGDPFRRELEVQPEQTINKGIVLR